MKKLCVFFFAVFMLSEAAFCQSFWESATDGSWRGTGTLMNSEADFKMNWKRVLDDHFLKLEFQNRRISNTGKELILKSHAYYHQKNDSLYEGTWFDSRGISFPVSGILKEATLTVTWGSPGIEQGKTIYTLVSKKEMNVTDYVLQEENYLKFGEAAYIKNEME